MAANIHFFFVFNCFKTKILLFKFFSISISPNLCSKLKTWMIVNTQGSYFKLCRKPWIILIGNREIKRPRICHDFKTANFNSREFKWGYSIWLYNDLLTMISRLSLQPVSLRSTFPQWLIHSKMPSSVCLSLHVMRPFPTPAWKPSDLSGIVRNM